MLKLPSDLDRSLAILSELAARDERIGEAMGDLGAVRAEALASLEEEPLTLSLHRQASDGSAVDDLEVALGPFGLQLLVTAEMGYEDVFALPHLFHSILQREPSVVTPFRVKRMRTFARLPVPLLAVRAASGASAERRKTIRAEGARSPFGIARRLFSPEADAPLGVRDLGHAFRAPVESDVPTLFISGSLDGHTPPFQAERMRAGLPNSGHVIVQYAGHEDLMPDPDVQARMLDFLEGATPQDAFLERPLPSFAPLE